MDSERLLALIGRIAVALETARQPDPAMRQWLEQVSAQQRAQLEQHQAAQAVADANWLKSHEAAKIAQEAADAHFASCEENHKRYFRGLADLERRIEALEGNAEPWKDSPAP